ncbi:2-oxoglutarate (2OG) and Fe(II)-dependent oxygenase superfamily protein [Euphorbia peplus]|nr:2-oxoglutarate (2OG) and Fe(II)-dependent oxygenase superfamily protein [Euphorbia peplus]
MNKAEIAVIDITSSEWREVCIKVREACEIHGCFLITNNEIITQKLHQDSIMGIKSLFDLPEETKNKYINPKPYRSYTSNSSSCPNSVPLFQSFGLDHPHHFDVIQSFTNLMWPQGNPAFSENFHKMSSKMVEVNYLVLKMIFESFGIEKHYESHIKDSISLMRIMKYIAPASGGCSDGESVVALPAHTDKNAITVLCQNEVQGLELQTEDGQWAQLFVPQNALLVFVGEPLKVWSNGRLKAVRHRVVMRGKEDRYSFGVFSMPKEESRIEVPLELVDKDHPLLYKPFIFSDYLSYFVSKLSDDALDIFAAL